MRLRFLNKKSLKKRLTPCNLGIIIQNAPPVKSGASIMFRAK